MTLAARLPVPKPRRPAPISLAGLSSQHTNQYGVQVRANDRGSACVCHDRDARTRSSNSDIGICSKRSRARPGFYTSNDRNYPYLGTRGFGRPSDYNNRILLLVDGQTLNDQVWGQAMVGADFPLDLDAIERIEVVRGPSSALYGTSAMFAVVNIITKTGIQLDGLSLSGRVGSAGARQPAMTAGRGLGIRGLVAASGLVTHTDGRI